MHTLLLQTTRLSGVVSQLYEMYMHLFIIILMTREARVAYKSIKYELCNLKAECTNLAKEFTTVVFLDVNR